jgi:hypothetical protein
VKLLAAGFVMLASLTVRSPDARAEEPAPKPAESLFQPEPYATAGFVFFSSDRRLIAGLGGGLGVRLGIGSHVALHAEGRAISFAGNAVTFAGGVSYRFRYQAWEPFGGVQYAGFAGDQVKVVTSTQPELPPPYAWAVQGRLSLLRFVREPWTAAALAVDLGFGDDAGTRAFALSITFLELGVRF